MTYEIGQLARLEVIFQDINGNPADPTTVSVLVQSPDGTQVNYNPPDVVCDGTGSYHFDLLVLQAGSYLYQWNGTGVLVAVQEGSITVAESILTAPVAPPIDLCSLDEVRDWLNLGPGQSDLKLERLITSASRMILTLTHRTSFNTPQITAERRNGNGQNKIAVYQWPIISVQSVVVQGGIFGTTNIPASPDGITPGWINDSNVIYLVGQYWFNKGFQNVNLGYTNGFASVPEDINQACVELVCQKYTRSRHIDEDSQSMMQQVVSYSKRDIPPEVQTVIGHYQIKGYIE